MSTEAVRRKPEAMDDEPLDLPFIEASVNYLGERHFGPNAVRPVIHPTDDSRGSIDLQPYRVRIYDARPIQAELSLAREGFVLVRHKLPALNMNDYDELQKAYLATVQSVVEEVTGAPKVVVTDGVFMRTTKAAHAPVGWMTPGKPALHVHTDYTATTARQVIERSYDRKIADPAKGYADTQEALQQSVDAAAGRKKYQHVIGVQTWRVTTPPPHDSTLTVCAANTVSPEDIVEGDFIAEFPGAKEPVLIPECFYAYNPNHRWFYFPDMEPDEVLVFMSFDFETPERGRVIHSAFEVPNQPSGAHRTSVEGRAFAFLKN